MEVREQALWISVGGSFQENSRFKGPEAVGYLV